MCSYASVHVYQKSRPKKIHKVSIHYSNSNYSMIHKRFNFSRAPVLPYNSLLKEMMFYPIPYGSPHDLTVALQSDHSLIGWPQYDTLDAPITTYSPKGLEGWGTLLGLVSWMTHCLAHDNINTFITEQRSYFNPHSRHTQQKCLL